MLIVRILSITARRPTLGLCINLIANNECVLIYYRTYLVQKRLVFRHLASGYLGFLPATSMVLKPWVFHNRSCNAPLQATHRVAESDKLI